MRAEPECTLSPTVRMKSPNEPASPSRGFGAAGGGCGAGALSAAGVPGGGTGGAGGAGRAASAFWMLNHCGQDGARPPPPRVHFEKPNGSPILKAK